MLGRQHGHRQSGFSVRGICMRANHRITDWNHEDAAAWRPANEDRTGARPGVINALAGAMRQQLRGNAAEISQAYTVDMAQPDSAPLTGYRIAVTSARRAEELCALLSRQGAEVCSAPAINMIALPDDDELHSNTDALIATPPDILVAHTGIGFRGWG